MTKYQEQRIARQKGAAVEQLSFGQRLKKAWMNVAHKMGMFNSRLILTLFYFIILMPYAIILMPFQDLMRMKSKQTWIPRKTTDLTLDDARRQS